ncbi:DsbA family oxidoreductase [Aestuariivita boseongensis]|uniref:DsbA family oxidoreductase n=1 Tax=Aestuariivita boseongensis TaxID=1470562 RepID=UPI00067FBB78|nr:DsbA family oxidoreductase [Aestuariivita boseongensis]
MTAPSPAPIRVDIVSDVVCPWCAIGYLQLAKAAREQSITLDIHWHPFELNPHMAEEGENLFNHLSAKYGITAQQSAQTRAQITQLGQDLGFEFRFSDDMFMWNTFRAHQLIDWAEHQGKAHDLKLALLKAHFTDRRNVSDIDTLCAIAASVGLDADTARVVLENATYADEVRGKQAFWTSKGVQGVPAMIFAGRYGVTGAQGVENYGRILTGIAAGTAA